MLSALGFGSPTLQRASNGPRTATPGSGCNAYWVTRKLRPSQGRVYPVAPVDVHKYFPGVGHVGWHGDASGPSGDYYLVFSAGWFPESTMRQPAFSVSAVPVGDLESVQEWFENSRLA